MTSKALAPAQTNGFTSSISALWGRFSSADKRAETKEDRPKHRLYWTMLIADVPAYRISGYPIEEIESLCRDSHTTLRLTLIALQARDRVEPVIEDGLSASWQTARSCANLSGKVGDHQGVKAFTTAHEPIEDAIRADDVLTVETAIQSALELLEVALARAFGEAALRKEVA